MRERRKMKRGKKKGVRGGGGMTKDGARLCNTTQSFIFCCIQCTHLQAKAKEESTGSSKAMRTYQISEFSTKSHTFGVIFPPLGTQQRIGRCANRPRGGRF